jgi:hypothetical protein
MTRSSADRQVVIQIPCSVPARLSDSTVCRIFGKLLQIGQADASETIVVREIESPDARAAAAIVCGSPTLAPAELMLFYIHASDEDGADKDLLVWAATAEEAGAHWRAFFDVSEPNARILWTRSIPLERKPGPICWDQLAGLPADDAMALPAPQG